MTYGILVVCIPLTVLSSVTFMSRIPNVWNAANLSRCTAFFLPFLLSFLFPFYFLSPSLFCLFTDTLTQLLSHFNSFIHPSLSSPLGSTALREPWPLVLFASTGLYPELSFSIN
jgi:hypothetical protein